MKNIKSFKLFESSTSPNFCDHFYKTLDSIKSKYDDDKKEVLKEYQEMVGECMFDLTDNFEYVFEMSEDSLRCFYTFKIETSNFTNTTWLDHVDKFEKESKIAISKLEGFDMPYGVYSRLGGFDGINKNIYNKFDIIISDMKSDGLKYKSISVILSVGD